ncbi:MAG: sulfatase [Alphaproteobacteria bacterium]|nr:sulfatase [Alphaproteobacteria bacterium]
MILFHYPFYKYVFTHLDVFSLGGALTFLSTFIILYVLAFISLFLIALISIRALKILSMVIIITNSIALYFVLTYHVILDRTMMGNVFNTDTGEAASYYSPKIFFYLFFLGILPAYAISKIHIQKAKKLHLAMQSFTIVIISVFLLYLNSPTWLWIDKNAKYVGALAMPWSYTVNAARYQLKEFKQNKKQELLPDGKLANDNKMIVVLVIGESARAANFSLYGYNKETNPYLSKLGIVALQGATSSATYTTASINSILSPTGSTSDEDEPLSSYLQRQGIDVIWRSNNWGEPTMKVQTYQKAEDLRKQCTGEGCDYDEVLLTGLDNEIKNSPKNKTFVVLHNAGSPGPTYYKKYPQAFEVFKPVCKSVDLQICTKQELVNAYDNTILYTDYFLSKVIGTLKNHDEIPSLLVYVSDHGESLGESGFYLHGTPYAIAPDFQKNIPFLFWTSPAFVKENKLENREYKENYNQKNIFHTVMGAFNMTGKIYDQQLDIFHKTP